MKIRQKLFLAFLVIASLVGVVGYISITTSQEALKDSVGEAALRLVSRTLDEIDQRILARAEELQAFAKDLSLEKKAAASNAQFDKIPNVQAHTRKIDKDWIDKKDSPFIQGILSNELSSTLTKHIEFYKQKYGYAVIAEMYVTNRYGVVIGSTGRTSDYLQADEGWYQRAVAEKGFWVGEVEYDESSKTFAIDIVVNLYDNDGNFVGIVKSVLNLEDIRRTIDEMQARSQYRSMQPYLVDRKGLLVFSGLDPSLRKLGRDVRLEEFGKDLSSRRAVIQASQGNEGFSVGTVAGKQKLVVFSYSKGFREFRGLDWSLVADFDTREILGEVIEVRDTLFIVSLILVVVAGVIGLFISRSISKPIVQLSEMAKEIGEGNLGKRVDIKSKDEIGVLASSFNQMVVKLQDATVSRDRSYEQAEIRSRELSALYSVSAVVNQSLDLAVVLRSVMHEVLEIFGFDSARIYMLDEDGKKLYLLAHEGFPKDVIPSSYEIGEGYLGRSFGMGEPTFFEDIQEDSEFRRFASKKVMLRAGYRGMFSISIGVKGKNVGVMNFASKAVHRFSSNEVQLISSIANYIGIAIENASLFKETKQQAVELENSNKVKDEFLSIMSHELRTPLNVITGYAGMVKDGLLGEINQEQEKALEKVANQSKDLLGMITGILEATSIEAETIKVESHEVNLGGFLDDLRSCYVGPMNKKFTLNWNYPSDLPVVKTDSEKLKHILQNLINNAIKFTEKGSVTISVRCLDGAGVAVGSGKQAEGNEEVEFKVADTGIGIPKESLPIIFEKFRQVDSSETRLYGGVGMGLHIVKQFTEMLGGKVEVESEPGKGSTFTVTLPY